MRRQFFGLTYFSCENHMTLNYDVRFRSHFLPSSSSPHGQQNSRTKKLIESLAVLTRLFSSPVSSLIGCRSASICHDTRESHIAHCPMPCEQTQSIFCLRFQLLLKHKFQLQVQANYVIPANFDDCTKITRRSSYISRNDFSRVESSEARKRKSGPDSKTSLFEFANFVFRVKVRCDLVAFNVSTCSLGFARICIEKPWKSLSAQLILSHFEISKSQNRRVSNVL